MLVQISQVNFAGCMSVEWNESWNGHTHLYVISSRRFRTTEMFRNVENELPSDAASYSRRMDTRFWKSSTKLNRLQLCRKSHPIWIVEFYIQREASYILYELFYCRFFCYCYSTSASELISVLLRAWAFHLVYLWVCNATNVILFINVALINKSEK